MTNPLRPIAQVLSTEAKGNQEIIKALSTSFQGTQKVRKATSFRETGRADHPDFLIQNQGEKGRSKEKENLIQISKTNVHAIVSIKGPTHLVTMRSGVLSRKNSLPIRASVIEDKTGVKDRHRELIALVSLLRNDQDHLAKKREVQASTQISDRRGTIAQEKENGHMKSSLTTSPG